MSRRRVVITGMGCLTPVALTAEESWQAVLAGVSGVGPLTHFDSSIVPVRIAGEVKGFDPHQWMGKPEARRMDRFTQFAVAAAQQAVDDAALEVTDSNRTRIGVLIGSGIGGIGSLEREIAHAAE